MTKEYFDKICTDVILPYAEELQDFDIQLNCNCLKLKKSAFNKIYYNYEKKRRIIRRYFMNLEKQPMDRHKIGAVLIYAILKSHVFSIKLTKQKLPKELLMANEYLAVYVALAVVESYRRDDLIKENKPLEDERWRLVIPDTFHDNSLNAYIDNLCKALYYVKKPGNLDIFAYSNILYLLEVYTNTENKYNLPQKS